MSSSDEICVLVKTASMDPLADIMKVVRAYLSNSRAEEDRELLAEADPTGCYHVVPVQYIDN